MQKEGVSEEERPHSSIAQQKEKTTDIQRRRASGQEKEGLSVEPSETRMSQTRREERRREGRRRGGERKEDSVEDLEDHWKGS